MSTNYDLLKAELQTSANLLTTAMYKYKALILIDQYIAALTKQAESSANDVQSYSIGDRSVTRSGATGYAKMVTDLESQLMAILNGGGVTFTDFRLYGNQNQS